MTMKLRDGQDKYKRATFRNSMTVHISENERAAGRLRLFAKEYLRCKSIQEAEQKLRSEEAAEEHNKQQKDRMLGGCNG